MTLIPFGILVAVLALVVHSVQRDYSKAVMVTAFSSAVILEVVSYQQRGYLEKLAMIEMMFAAGVATIIGAAVGGPFVYYRHRRERNTTGRLQ